MTGGVLGHLLDSLGERERSRPAVGLSRAVEDRAAPGRVRRRREEVLQAVHGVVQEVGVHVADGDVDLSGELAADLAPALLKVGRQVRVFAPVSRDALVDRARLGVEERLEVAALPDRPVHRLPAVPVLAGAPARAEGALVLQLLLHRRAHDALRVALAGQGHA